MRQLAAAFRNSPIFIDFAKSASKLAHSESFAYINYAAFAVSGGYGLFGRTIFPKGVRMMRRPCASVSADGTCAGGGFVCGGFVCVVRCCTPTGRTATGCTVVDPGAGVGNPAIRPAAGLPPPTTITGVPPVIGPPPNETTRVDSMGVFPVCGFLEPSCRGMISFRVPLSRTMYMGEMSVMVNPR